MSLLVFGVTEAWAHGSRGTNDHPGRRLDWTRELIRGEGPHGARNSRKAKAQRGLAEATALIGVHAEHALSQIVGMQLTTYSAAHNT